MPSPERSALKKGHEIDAYRIERKIADGGFGITYLAQQKTFERPVAIKEYLPRDLAVRVRRGALVEPRSADHAQDFQDGLDQFREEGKTLVSFEHPNIVTAHDFREANGTAYLVLQYVPGKSLKARLDEHGPLSESELMPIIGTRPDRSPQ